MKILSLIDHDTYVEGVTMNYTNEWIEEVVTTHNAFKAKDVSDLLKSELKEIAIWIREHQNTLLEIKEIV